MGRDPAGLVTSEEKKVKTEAHTGRPREATGRGWQAPCQGPQKKSTPMPSLRPAASRTETPGLWFSAMAVRADACTLRARWPVDLKEPRRLGGSCSPLAGHLPASIMRGCLAPNVTCFFLPSFGRQGQPGWINHDTDRWSSSAHFTPWDSASSCFSSPTGVPSHLCLCHSVCTARCMTVLGGTTVVAILQAWCFSC